MRRRTLWLTIAFTLLALVVAVVALAPQLGIAMPPETAAATTISSREYGAALLGLIVLCVAVVGFDWEEWF